MGHAPGDTTPLMHYEQLDRPTIRAAVFLGLGLVFSIWLFLGDSFTRRITDVERQPALYARYTRAQELLSAVRSQVLLGSVSVRDALLDPETTVATQYRRQLE